MRNYLAKADTSSTIPISGKISGTEKGTSKIFSEITINPATKNLRIDYSGNKGSGYASSQISFSDFPEGIVKIGQSASSGPNGVFIKILNYYLYDKNNNLIKTLNTSNQDNIAAFRDYYSYTISWS